MRRGRRPVHVTIVLSAALVAFVAFAAGGCGASGSSAISGGQPTPARTTRAASVNPLGALNSRQILSRALADTEHAASVRVTGSVRDSGQTITLDLTLLRGKGCEGKLAVAKTGSFRLVDDGKTIWMLPDDQFYKSMGGADAAALTVLRGKYLKLKANGSGMAGMATMCSLHSLLGGFTSSGITILSMGTTTVHGQRAVKLSDVGDSASLVVSDTDKPELLEMDDPSSGGGAIAFGYGATRATITPPPASMVIDGSKYGF